MVHIEIRAMQMPLTFLAMGFHPEYTAAGYLKIQKALVNT